MNFQRRNGINPCQGRKCFPLLPNNYSSPLPWKHQDPLPCRAGFNSVLFHPRACQKNRGTTLSFNICYLGKPKKDFSFAILKRTQIIFSSIFHGEEAWGRKKRKLLQMKKISNDWWFLPCFHIDTHDYMEGREKQKNVSGIIDMYPSHGNWDLTLQDLLSWKVHSWSSYDLQRMECYRALKVGYWFFPPKPERISLSLIQLRHQRIQFWIAPKEKADAK